MFRCIIVAIIGSVGNLMTLLAIPWAIHKKKLGFHKTPWKFTHIFIVNLALADFLYCTTCLPLYSLTVGACLLVVKLKKQNELIEIMCSTFADVGQAPNGLAMLMQFSNTSMLMLLLWHSALWL